MQRIKGWEAAFYKATLSALQKPHEWGVHDCVLFGADCVLAVTGEDPANGVRGKYKTRIGAARIIKRAGFADLQSMIADRLPLISVIDARRADLVLNDGPEGEFIGIVDGHMSIAPAARGLLRVPLGQAKAAFKVG